MPVRVPVRHVFGGESARDLLAVHADDDAQVLESAAVDVQERGEFGEVAEVEVDGVEVCEAEHAVEVEIGWGAVEVVDVLVGDAVEADWGVLEESYACFVEPLVVDEEV